MILIFNGPPGSGKDEGCSYLETLGYKSFSFKHELFKETFKQFCVTEEWFMEGYNDRKIKEKYTEELGMSRRQALIHTSENIIKPLHGKDYFGNKVALFLTLDNNYCGSDAGFVEEVAPLINKFGNQNCAIIQLTRTGCDFSSDSRRYFDAENIEELVIGTKTISLPEQTYSHKFSVRMYRVHNNGTKEQFRENLKAIHLKEQLLEQQQNNTAEAKGVS